MAKIISITEHFQHFLAEMKEGFWGDVYGQTELAWKQFFEADSERQRDRYAVREAYQRRAEDVAMLTREAFVAQGEAKATQL
jgi:hypothetical protein